MHRDLKPENMGLKSMNPPDAVIFDFGHATFGKTSMDHFKGTIAYLAPEVLDLKYRHSQIAYDCAVDVWAMGLSLYQLTCRRRWTGQEVVKDAQGRVHDYRLTHLYAIIQELQRSKQTLISDVIPKMLQVNPRERITANSALMTIHADENKEKAFTESKRPRTE